MSTLKIGICGWGNVATGLYKIAKNNIESIKKQGNLDIEIVVIGARRDNPNCKPENVIALVAITTQGTIIPAKDLKIIPRIINIITA
jgi:homoserine dehydrogenase